MDRLAEIPAHLAGVDVEGSGQLDIPDVIPAEFDMHQSRRGLVACRVCIVAQALDKRGGAVADPDDPDPQFLPAHAQPFGFSSAAATTPQQGKYVGGNSVAAGLFPVFMAEVDQLDCIRWVSNLSDSRHKSKYANI